MAIARRLIVTGKVQGVFYRNWTVSAARDIGLTGWVRNRSDGAVEILAIGEAEALDRLIALCRAGPPSASVDAVSVSEAAPEALEGFSRRATA